MQRAQNGLGRRGRPQRRIDTMFPERRNGIADRQKNRKPKQKGRLADRLAPVDAVFGVVILEERNAKIGKRIIRSWDLVGTGRVGQ